MRTLLLIIIIVIVVISILGISAAFPAILAYCQHKTKHEAKSTHSNQALISIRLSHKCKYVVIAALEKIISLNPDLAKLKYHQHLDFIQFMCEQSTTIHYQGSMFKYLIELISSLQKYSHIQNPLLEFPFVCSDNEITDKYMEYISGCDVNPTFFDCFYQILLISFECQLCERVHYQFVHQQGIELSLKCSDLKDAIVEFFGTKREWSYCSHCLKFTECLATTEKVYGWPRVLIMQLPKRALKYESRLDSGIYCFNPCYNLMGVLCSNDQKENWGIIKHNGGDECDIINESAEHSEMNENMMENSNARVLLYHKCM